jgi:hypothetical protein
MLIYSNGDRIELPQQKKIDDIIEGKERGHYYLMIGEKVSLLIS